MQHKSFSSVLRQPWLFSVVVLLLVSFACAACGTNPTSTGGSGVTPPVTPTAHPGTANGCPNQTAIATTPAKAGIVLLQSANNTTVNVAKGSIVEVDLPFDHNWTNPTGNFQSNLTVQTPSGYAAQTQKMCVWRYLASNPGNVQLSYTGQALCKKNEACPMYVVMVSFTLVIK